MELIPQIGLVAWTSFVFITLLIALKLLAWKPILKALQDREESIETALSAAENAKLELQKLQADNEALLHEARKERDKMLQEASVTANTLIEEARNKATTEGARLLETARQAIETEKHAAIAQIKNQVAGLSVDIAEKILKKQLESSESQKQLVNQFLAESTIN
jgi:F-type H+-transporting ATPase subunit b